jgi:hypothetical protein
MFRRVGVVVFMRYGVSLMSRSTLELLFPESSDAHNALQPLMP